MSETRITSEEYKTVVMKSKNWLRKFLREMTEDAFVEPKRSQFINTVCDVYRGELLKDAVLFEKAKEFCSKKRTGSEKIVFMREVMGLLVERDLIKPEYKKRYPEEFK